jgi:hypothetical protein
VHKGVAPQQHQVGLSHCGDILFITATFGIIGKDNIEFAVPYMFNVLRPAVSEVLG